MPKDFPEMAFFDAKFRADSVKVYELTTKILTIFNEEDYTIPECFMAIKHLSYIQDHTMYKNMKGNL